MSKEKKNRKRLWPADDSDEENESGKAAKSAPKPPAKGGADDHDKSANLPPAQDESSGSVRRGKRNKQKDCAHTEKVVSTWERAEERLLQQAMAASLQCTGVDGVALPLPGKIFVTFVVRKSSGESTVLEQGDEEEIEVEVEPSTTPETLAEIVTKALSKRTKTAGRGGTGALSTSGKRLHFGTDWGFITQGRTLEAYDIRQGAALFCMIEDP